MNRGKNLENAIAYIHGRLVAELENFANSLQITSQELTTRLGTLLLAEGQGTFDSLPTLRGKTTQDGQTVESVALSSRPHRRAQKRPRGSKAKGPKRYWDNMSPEQRRREMKRRVAKRQLKLKAAA